VSGGPSVASGPGGSTIRSLPGWEGWTFDVTPGTVAGIPAVTAIKVTAPEGEPVTAGKFKRIPVALLIRLAVDRSPHVAGVAARVAPDPARLRARPGSPEHLAAVVTLYRFALSQSVPPRDAIAAHFDVSTKTVDRWLSRARESGVLGSYAEERAQHEMTPERWAERKRAEGVTSPLKPNEAEALAERVRRRFGLDSVEDEG
jgi:hypothetical protein